MNLSHYSGFLGLALELTRNTVDTIISNFDNIKLQYSALFRPILTRSNSEQSFGVLMVVMVKKRVKSFPSHLAHRAALISVFLALSQTPVYTARPQILG